MPDHDPSLAELLMQAAESYTTLVDFAAGQRAEMIDRGFSPEAAEVFAMEILLHFAHLSFGATSQ